MISLSLVPGAALLASIRARAKASKQASERASEQATNRVYFIPPCCSFLDARGGANTKWEEGGGGNRHADGEGSSPPARDIVSMPC